MLWVFLQAFAVAYTHHTPQLAYLVMKSASFPAKNTGISKTWCPAQVSTQAHQLFLSSALPSDVIQAARDRSRRLDMLLQGLLHSLCMLLRVVLCVLLQLLVNIELGLRLHRLLGIWQVCLRLAQLRGVCTGGSWALLGVEALEASQVLAGLRSQALCGALLPT